MRPGAGHGPNIDAGLLRQPPRERGGKDAAIGTLRQRKLIGLAGSFGQRNGAPLDGQGHGSEGALTLSPGER